MTQIIDTLEDGYNFSIIKNAIKMIKGVKNVFVTHGESNKLSVSDDSRMKLFDQLAGSISIDNIDTEDNRTHYLLHK